VCANVSQNRRSQSDDEHTSDSDKYSPVPITLFNPQKVQKWQCMALPDNVWQKLWFREYGGCVVLLDNHMHVHNWPHAKSARKTEIKFGFCFLKIKPAKTLTSVQTVFR